MIKKYIKNILFPFIGPTYTRLKIELEEIKEKKRYHLCQLQKFEAILLKNGYSLQNFKKVFEFGCGPGRLLQFYQKIAPEVELTGCDTVQHLVKITKKVCPDAHVFINDIAPPLNIENEKFDFIYSYSVFTHLTEENHISWLKELSSKMKPGGIALHTTHSTECFKRTKVFSPETIKKYEIPIPIDQFISSLNRYYYVMNDPSLPEYGLIVIPQSYIFDNWPKYSGLEVLDYDLGAIEAFPEGCQDIVLLRKPK